MEKESKKWGFQGKKELNAAAAITVRGVLNMLTANLNKEDSRPMVPLGHGDPSRFPSFRTSPAAEDAIIHALRSANYNSYAPTVGILPARRAIADFLNRDMSYKLSPDDVYLTIGCTQAIEVTLAVLSRPGANILLPRPGFPYYEAYAASKNLEVRHYDLLPDNGWQVDLDSIETHADENTAAMVIINPGNPCGNVFSYQHLEKVAETARKLGILLISDEAYDNLAFGSTKYVPMRVFGSIVPVLTLGSISKRWIVPGWRLGWLVTTDPNGILRESGIIDSIIGFLDISSDPATFIQVWDSVKLNISMLEDIKDDVDFCVKLVKEESVMILPGVAVGMKNWLRVTFAVELSSLEEGLARVKTFCQRHAKKQ
ncbi:Aminotransferase, class I/classII [Corchorus olitorius]|uniref:Aminotransferase, class I/classII n=1 Tax=Corchorus olitorius TaxID=93759 RepID=A0A1R3JAI6_9ROSI|nr:Aminotransferase, class I/classII [Corchorus olitorius]